MEYPYGLNSWHEQNGSGDKPDNSCLADNASHGFIFPAEAVH